MAYQRLQMLVQIDQIKHMRKSWTDSNWPT